MPAEASIIRLIDYERRSHPERIEGDAEVRLFPLRRVKHYPLGASKLFRDAWVKAVHDGVGAESAHLIGNIGER